MTVLAATHTAQASWPLDGLPVSDEPATRGFPPVIAADGAGGAIVAWAQNAPYQSPDLYAQHMLAAGGVDPAWPPAGLAVCTAANSQYYPSIVGDGAGGAVVAWLDYRNGTDNDIYAEHVLATGAVDPAWPPAGLAVCTAANDQAELTMMPDGEGGAIATWSDNRSGVGDIYAQHVLASGVADPNWPPDGRALCTAVDDQRRPRIVTDAGGGAIVVWDDARSGSSNRDIYAQHVLASGAVDPAWPVDGRALCTAVGNQYFAEPVTQPKIISDGAGGAIATWDDYRSGSSADIYCQHVLASGAVDPDWPPDGRAVCAAARNQSLPTIAPDGAGGAIITWADDRSGDGDIYAHHVLATGAMDPAWPTDGVTVCTVVDLQQPDYTPTIVPDGAGGAIICWTDGRSSASYFDIYAQRVLASGALDPVWPPDGRALCSAMDDQDRAAIVSDGLGGAIAAWQDWRSGSPDIFVQRVYADGGVALAVTDRTHASRFDEPWPNPAHGEVRIRFQLPAPRRLSIDVFDLAGRHLRRLVNLQTFASGAHSLTWDGMDDRGVRVRSGVYVVRMGLEGRTESRRVAIVR